MTGTKRPMKSLLELSEEVPDPRVERGKLHDLGEILLVAVCTTLVGREGAYDMADLGEARVERLRSLGLQGTRPGHGTFTRVFGALDPVAFAEAFAMWTRGLGERLGREVVAPNGKAAYLGRLRRLALNLLRHDKSLDRGIHRIQLLAAINPEYLAQSSGFLMGGSAHRRPGRCR